MHDSAEQRIKRIMADILRLDPRKIDDNTAQENTPAWDSTNHISLILALEEEFSMSFAVAEIETMLSFRDVARAVAARGEGGSNR